MKISGFGDVMPLVRQKLASVSEESSCSFFEANRVSCSFFLYPDYEERWFHWRAGKFVPDCTTSHPRRVLYNYRYENFKFVHIFYLYFVMCFPYNVLNKSFRFKYDVCYKKNILFLNNNQFITKSVDLEAGLTGKTPNYT
jgi:hypothetical protein